MLPFRVGTCKSITRIMSKKGSTPDNGEPAPDLSALDFGPAWARPDQGSKGRAPSKGKSHSGSSSKPPSKPSAPSRGRQPGNPGHRRGPSAERQDRHGEAGGDRRGGHHKGRGRKDFSQGDRERKHVPHVPPPEGVTARIMPIEEGLDAMAKQISATGRTHSVFDLAWLVLGALDRFHVIFESADQPLYRSETDHSVWQSKKECMDHFRSSKLIDQYYDEEITEVDPPSGNFQSVARCGISKQLIGPPNHHGYQQALLDLHREKFANMPLERYKSKIIMEHGEEAVQEWIDAMCKRKRWRPKAAQPEPESVQEEVEEPAQQVEEPAQQVEEPAQQVEEPAQQVEEPVQQVEEPAPEAEAAQSEQSEPVLSEEPQSQEREPAAPVPAAEQTLAILDNYREVEQHFSGHGFDKEFYGGKTVSALANIPPRMISPALMGLLRNTVAEEKRYPGNLASILCRQMSGRHLAVFKWKKRLHCGPARPRHVPDDLLMADRPSKMFHWVIDHPGGNIDQLWKDCLPPDIEDATRHTWYHDLHWLINEGFVLFFSDGTLHAAKELSNNEAVPPAQVKKKTAGKKTAKAQNSADKQVHPDPGAESKASAGSDPDQQEAQQEE